MSRAPACCAQARPEHGNSYLKATVLSVPLAIKISQFLRVIACSFIYKHYTVSTTSSPASFSLGEHKKEATEGSHILAEHTKLGVEGTRGIL